MTAVEKALLPLTIADGLLLWWGLRALDTLRGGSTMAFLPSVALVLGCGQLTVQRLRRRPLPTPEEHAPAFLWMAWASVVVAAVTVAWPGLPWWGIIPAVLLAGGATHGVFEALGLPGWGRARRGSGRAAD